MAMVKGVGSNGGDDENDADDGRRMTIRYWW